jgi:hypothetical protein
MAKLFYTLEEAAQKLGKSTDEVMNMARSGQLQDLKDKGETLFRRSAIDQLAGATDGSGSFNLDNLDIGSEGSSMELAGSDVGDLGDLRLEDSTAGAPSPVASAPRAGTPANDDMPLELDLGGDDALGLSDDDGGLNLADSGSMVAASGADESMGLDDLALVDDEPAAAPAPARPAPAPAGRGGSSIGLDAGSGASSIVDEPAERSSGGSMVFDAGAQLEAVGGGSGLLDISSDESFFGAQMIEESMSGDDAAEMPADAGELFGGDAAAGDVAEPVTVGTAPAVAFGTQALAEARDPKFSGFAGGALVVAALAMVAMGWAVAEMMLGNYTDVAKMIAENWMYVLGGGAAGVLVFGGVGLGIGKAVG